MAVDYKFNEELLVEEVMDYINSTYDAHYGANGLQSSEVIVDRGRGLDFFLGNIDKYNGRYGSKGESPDDYRKDLMKIVTEELTGTTTIYDSPRRSFLDEATPEEWDRVHKSTIVEQRNKKK